MTPKAKDQFVARMVKLERAFAAGDAAGGMSRAIVPEPVDETGTRLASRCGASGYSTSGDSWRREHDNAQAANILA